MRFTLSFLFLLPTYVFAADCKEIYQATCRINNNATGVVFAQDKTDLWVITAGHVMTDRNNKLEKKFVVHFFSTGTQSPGFKAEPLWHVHEKLLVTRHKRIVKEILTTKDLGFLKIKKDQFLGEYPLPKPVPLAPQGTKVKKDQMILSCGCPNGNWPSGWKGNVLEVFPDRFRFHPSPIPGRSGSGIFTDDGIVGIIIWYMKGENKYGTALSLDKIYEETKWDINN